VPHVPPSVGIAANSEHNYIPYLSGKYIFFERFFTQCKYICSGYTNHPFSSVQILCVPLPNNPTPTPSPAKVTNLLNPFFPQIVTVLVVIVVVAFVVVAVVAAVAAVGAVGAVGAVVVVAVVFVVAVVIVVAVVVSRSMSNVARDCSVFKLLRVNTPHISLHYACRILLKGSFKECMSCLGVYKNQESSLQPSIKCSLMTRRTSAI
jgi:hypothetical protein